MSTQLKIKYDENEADKKLQQVKKFGIQNGKTNEIKRAALGELGNRAVLRTVRDGQKDLKDPKNQINLRNAKSRVDTHWKKPTQPTVVANNVQPAVPGGNVNAVAQKKIVTRSNSIKSGTTGLLSAVAGKQILPKPTTITAKVVNIENKISHVRYINKPKIESTKEQPLAQAVVPAATTLRREDSNLSRKSLSKLKAAIKQQSIKPTAQIAPSCKSTTELKEKEKDNTTTTTDSAKCEIKIVSVESHSTKLLNLVENIDADDTENPILVSEYVNDIYSYLFTLETQLAIEPDHLKDQKQVVPKMRAVLIDWINEVHHQFHLVPETFHMCVAIIDRYLQAVKTTARHQLQLVGVTALFIASKYEELFPPAIGDFVYITDDTYTKFQVLEMEMKIMKALDFNLARPLPIHFLRRFSKAASAEDSHHAMSKYFLELVTTEYSMAGYRPSEIAAASLYLSLQLINPQKTPEEAIWTPTLEFYSRYTADHLEPITRQIANLARYASTAKLKAVHVKYQSVQLGKISLRPELMGPVIDQIIAKGANSN